MQSIIRRILADKPIDQEMTSEERETFLHESVPKWIKEFEESGFLESTRLPAIRNEDEFLEKLEQHKDDLMVIKYWKHGCLPCLSIAEMVKEAEKKCIETGKKIFWYSVDSRSPLSKDLIDYQLISGTPTIQTFHGQRQVGKEIRTTHLEELLREVFSRAPQ